MSPASVAWAAPAAGVAATVRGVAACEYPRARCELIVVDNGSGRAARIPGVQVAGKTGTAQVSDEVADHTWFMGFAPADDPQIAVAVFVANGGGTGGERSAPIAPEVIEARRAEAEAHKADFETLAAAPAPARPRRRDLGTVVVDAGPNYNRLGG